MNDERIRSLVFATARTDVRCTIVYMYCKLTYRWCHVINGYISRNYVTVLTIDVHSEHVNIQAIASVQSPLNLIVL